MSSAVEDVIANVRRVLSTPTADGFPPNIITMHASDLDVLVSASASAPAMLEALKGFVKAANQEVMSLPMMDAVHQAERAILSAQPNEDSNG